MLWAMRGAALAFITIATASSQSAMAKVYPDNKVYFGNTINAPGGDDRDLFAWGNPGGDRTATAIVETESGKPLTIIAYDIRLNEIGRAISSEGHAALTIAFSKYGAYLRVVPTGGLYDLPVGTPFKRTVAQGAGKDDLLPAYKISFVDGGIPSAPGAAASQETTTKAPVLSLQSILAEVDGATPSAMTALEPLKPADIPNAQVWGPLARLGGTNWHSPENHYLIRYEWRTPGEELIATIDTLSEHSEVDEQLSAMGDNVSLTQNGKLLGALFSPRADIFIQVSSSTQRQVNRYTGDRRISQAQVLQNGAWIDQNAPDTFQRISDAQYATIKSALEKGREQYGHYQRLLATVREPANWLKSSYNDFSLFKAVVSPDGKYFCIDNLSWNGWVSKRTHRYNIWGPYKGYQQWISVNVGHQDWESTGCDGFIDVTDQIAAQFAAEDAAQQNAEAQQRASAAQQSDQSSDGPNWGGALFGAFMGSMATNGSLEGTISGAKAYMQGGSEGLYNQISDDADTAQQKAAESDANFHAAINAMQADYNAKNAAAQSSALPPQAQQVAAAPAITSPAATIPSVNPTSVNAQPGPPISPPGSAATATQATPPTPRAPATMTTNSPVTVDGLNEGAWSVVQDFAGVTINARYRHELADQVISELQIVNANDYPVYVSITPKYICRDGSSHSAFARSVDIQPNGVRSGDGAGLSDYACNSAQPTAIGYSSLSVTAK